MSLKHVKGHSKNHSKGMVVSQKFNSLMGYITLLNKCMIYVVVVVLEERDNFETHFAGTAGSYICSLLIHAVIHCTTDPVTRSAG